MKVAILDYDAGNIYSVSHALKRLGLEAIVTNDVRQLQLVDKVIFPGQGEARTTMQSLRATGLDRFILETKKPVLGICVGMQLMCSHSEENDTDCLGIFDTTVRRFIPTSLKEKVPHIGWNQIEQIKEESFIGCELEQSFVYYVHSFYVPINRYTIAQTNYTLPYSAALQKDNYHAVQFHPEKSGSVGEAILKAFLEG